jgi:hypothetical protein
VVIVGEAALRRVDAKALERARRDARACSLRAQGWELAAIEEKLGFARGHAAPAIRRALVETLRAPADELRGVELVRLNQAIRQCWEVIEHPMPMTDRAGRPVVVLDDDGEEIAVADQQVVVAAIAQVGKLSEQIRRLMGLDAPQRSITAKASVTLQDLQEMAIANGVPAAEVYQLRDGDEPGAG